MNYMIVFIDQSILMNYIAIDQCSDMATARCVDFISQYFSASMNFGSRSSHILKLPSLDLTINVYTEQNIYQGLDRTRYKMNKLTFLDIHLMKQ